MVSCRCNRTSWIKSDPDVMGGPFLHTAYINLCCPVRCTGGFWSRLKTSQICHIRESWPDCLTSNACLSFPQTMTSSFAAQAVPKCFVRQWFISLSEFLLWCTVFSVMMSTQLFGPCDENQHEQLPKAQFWSLKSVSIDNVSSASAHTVGNDACSPREGVFSFELSQQSWGD